MVEVLPPVKTKWIGSRDTDVECACSTNNAMFCQFLDKKENFREFQRKLAALTVNLGNL